MELLLLDDAIEHDAQHSGAGDGALMAEVIEPLELALGDHDGDGGGGRQHRQRAGSGAGCEHKPALRRLSQ